VILAAYFLRRRKMKTFDEWLVLVGRDWDTIFKYYTKMAWDYQQAKISKLEQENKKLKEQIEKLKNCGNCYNSQKYGKRYYENCPKEYAVYKCEKWEIEK
jgi:hypothetical protein